jgi:NAD kinase
MLWNRLPAIIISLNFSLNIRIRPNRLPNIMLYKFKISSSFSMSNPDNIIIIELLSLIKFNILISSSSISFSPST